MPELTREEFTRIAKDAMYATVGVGVLTAQHLGQLRHQIAERLTAQYGVGKDQVDQLVKAVEAQLRTIDDRVKVLEGQIDGLLDTVQVRLPEQASDVLARARKAATEAGERLTEARKAATEASEKLTGFVRDTAA